ncbi:MAG: hypothetical protein L0Z54_03970, partial [Thermoplasmata archaeon]|nr:hypothetical protein [Thermoplasmata archaeon]
SPSSVARLEAAIRLIEERSHLPGLTQEVERFLGAGRDEPPEPRWEPEPSDTAPIRPAATGVEDWPTGGARPHPEVADIKPPADAAPADDGKDMPEGSAGDFIAWAKREGVREKDLANGAEEGEDYGETVPGTNVKLIMPEEEEVGD